MVVGLWPSPFVLAESYRLPDLLRIEGRCVKAAVFCLQLSACCFPLSTVSLSFGCCRTP